MSWWSSRQSWIQWQCDPRMDSPNSLQFDAYWKLSAMSNGLPHFNHHIHKFAINQTFYFKTQKTKAISSGHFYQLTFDLSSVEWEGEFQFSITASALARNFTYTGGRFDTRVMFWIVRTKRCKTRRKWSLRSRPSLSCRADTSFPQNTSVPGMRTPREMMHWGTSIF